MDTDYSIYLSLFRSLEFRENILQRKKFRVKYTFYYLFKIMFKSAPVFTCGAYFT